VVFRAVVFKLLVWCGAEGYVSGLQDAAASCKPYDLLHYKIVNSTSSLFFRQTENGSFIL